MGKVTYGDFKFDSGFGFTGSAAGRADPKSHPQRSSNEYGGGLKKGGAVCMAKGGPIKKAMGGPLGSLLQNPAAQAAAARTAGALTPPGATPAANPMMQPAMPPSGMKRGGKFKPKRKG